MSPKPKQGCKLLVVFSMAFLLSTLPVLAQPAREPLEDAWRKVAALSDSVLARIGHLILDVWQEGAVKEGTSIDPNGGSKPQEKPPGASTEEGVTIDPNGHP